jgi:hypothetical protein
MRNSWNSQISRNQIVQTWHAKRWKSVYSKLFFDLGLGTKSINLLPTPLVPHLKPPRSECFHELTRPHNTCGGFGIWMQS